MPIYAQWKWIEKTQTFLLVLHFDDDYSEQNLRTREMNFSDPRGKDKLRFYVPEDVISEETFPDAKKRTVVTWAPSHIEAGHLLELLSCANIINGFKLPLKIALRPKLEIGFVKGKNNRKAVKEALEMLREEFMGKKNFLFGYDINYRDNEPISLCCFEVCQEYLNYLKRVLKPYS